MWNGSKVEWMDDINMRPKKGDCCERMGIEEKE